jgi:hypothetical protein
MWMPVWQLLSTIYWQMHRLSCADDNDHGHPHDNEHDDKYDYAAYDNNGSDNYDHCSECDNNDSA